MDRSTSIEDGAMEIEAVGGAVDIDRLLDVDTRVKGFLAGSGYHSYPYRLSRGRCFAGAIHFDFVFIAAVQVEFLSFEGRIIRGDEIIGSLGMAYGWDKLGTESQEGQEAGDTTHKKKITFILYSPEEDGNRNVIDMKKAVR